MALELYRRHSRTCTAGLKFGTFTYKADELRRKVKRCECAITASGTLNERFARRSTDTCDWVAAEAWAAMKEAADNWDAVGQTSVAVVAPVEQSPVTVDDALARFLGF